MHILDGRKVKLLNHVKQIPPDEMIIIIALHLGSKVIGKGALRGVDKLINCKLIMRKVQMPWDFFFKLSSCCQLCNFLTWNFRAYKKKINKLIQIVSEAAFSCFSYFIALAPVTCTCQINQPISSLRRCSLWYTSNRVIFLLLATQSTSDNLHNSWIHPFVCKGQRTSLILYLKITDKTQF